MRHLLLVALLSCSGFLSAQIYSNEFLTVGVGPRALALGNSVIASSDDVYSTYWNPAGLISIDAETDLVAGFTHSEQFGGAAKFDYLGVSIPIIGDSRRLGLSVIRQGTDDIPNTINLYNADGTVDYDNITTFSAADYAVLISYAQPTKLLNGNLNVGGNLKVIRRVLGSFSSAWGVGLDLGAQYHNGNFSAGVTLRDVTSTFNAWKNNLDDRTREVLVATGNSLPDKSGSEVTRPSLLPGIAYRFDVKKFGVAPQLAAWITFDGKRNTLLSSDPISMDLNAGLEVDYNQLVYLRFGVDQFQRIKDLGDDDDHLSARPALGLGVRYKRVRLDYAFSNPNSKADLYSHVFGLQVGLKH